MDRTRRLARLLAPVALVGSIAAATQPAHAAAPQTSTVAMQQMSPSTPSPDFSIKICVGDHCVTISF